MLVVVGGIDVKFVVFLHLASGERKELVVIGSGMAAGKAGKKR